MGKVQRKSKRIRRHQRIRAKIAGSAARPRLVVFRSNKHFSVQLVDDEKGRVIASFADRQLKRRDKKGEIVEELGKRIAEKAKEQNVKAIVFDRSGYKYHGQIKALAEAIRAQGIAF